MWGEGEGLIYVSKLYAPDRQVCGACCGHSDRGVPGDGDDKAMKLLRNWLFPELLLFHEKDDRKRAWRNAEYAVLKKPALWVGVLTIVVGGAYLTFSLPSLGVPIGHRGKVRGVIMAVEILAGYTLVWSFRRSIRRNLRMDLAQLGVPICVACGYNLTGNVSGVCPECATKVER